MIQNIESKLRETVKGLFSESKVDVVVGFRTGSLPETARPFFARSAKDADVLVWNSFCSNNLAVYLPKMFEKPQRPPKDYKPPRVGIVVKGCDARSVTLLTQEKQMPRENITIIGMPCEGMKSAPKHGANKTGELNRACVECVSPSVKGADISITGPSRAPAKKSYDRIKKFASQPAPERWEYFLKEISKCIRCNACREACPNCYCKVCFADQRKPAWMSPGNELSDVVVFHLGRMFHQAGRCVECDACVNACPMGIDLRLFTQKLASDAQELFGCVPGVSGSGMPALAVFTNDDTQCFITDPEEK
jgi:formate dehydrogenase (coenzyme F420) beta subunit